MRMKPLLTFLALTLILIVAACVPATPGPLRATPGTGSTPGAGQDGGTSAGGSNIPQTGGDVAAEDQVRNQILNFLTTQLNAASNSIDSVSLQFAEWPDSCLGLGGPAESCAAVVTPGWRVSARVNGQDFVLRANQDASVIRLDTQANQGNNQGGTGTGTGTGTAVPGGIDSGGNNQTPGAGGLDTSGTDQGGTGTGGTGTGAGTATPGTGTDGNNQGGAGTGGTGTGTGQGGEVTPGANTEGDSTTGSGNTASSGLDVGSGNNQGGTGTGGNNQGGTGTGTGGTDQGGTGTGGTGTGTGGNNQGGNVPNTGSGPSIFLFRPNDNGQSGQSFGSCGDSLVRVPSNVQVQNGDVANAIRQSYEAMFGLDEQALTGMNLNSAFQGSNLRLESVSVNRNGVAVIRFFGDLEVADNNCDPDRIRTQLVQVARQFNGVNDVQIFVNDRAIDDVLPNSALEPDQQQD